MSGNPAFEKRIKVCDTEDGTYEEVPAIDASLDDSNELLDDTDLMNDGSRSRVLGLTDWSISLTCNWDPDNDGLDIIRDGKTNRDTIYVQYLPDGAEENGFQGPVVVENYNFSGGVEDLETIDANLVADGALGDVPE